MARDQSAHLMSRRRLCWTLAGVVVAPGIAIAQTSKAVRRIGLLEPGMPDTPEMLWEQQVKPLREFGWIENQNLRTERRYDNGRPEALPALAEELVRAKVELIVTSGTPATLAAKRATATIPIVFYAGDPVLLGLVESLAQPGGNLTGISQAGTEVTAKRLSMLKELLPRLQRVAVLWQTENPYNRAIRSQFERICRSLGLETIFVEYAALGEIGRAIAQLAVKRRAQALVLSNDEFLSNHRFEIVDTATNNHLPTMAEEPTIVREAGALVAYSPTLIDQYRIRAEYIDRILRGAKPADLPVQQPTKFELVINLKTAKALGLTIHQSLLVRADEVIQ